MPRIRTIKPQFFANEDLAELPLECRILFIALWTLADAEGRLEYRPRRIGAYAFPYEPDLQKRIEEIIRLLEDRSFVIVYEPENSEIREAIQIRKFNEHQRITGKEAQTPSEIPPPGKHPGNNGETTEQQPRRQERKGRERKGRDIDTGDRGNNGETLDVSRERWKPPSIDEVLAAMGPASPSTKLAADYVLMRERDRDPRTGHWRIFNLEGRPRRLENWQADALSYARRNKQGNHDAKQTAERRSDRRSALGLDSATGQTDRSALPDPRS